MTYIIKMLKGTRYHIVKRGYQIGKTYLHSVSQRKLTINHTMNELEDNALFIKYKELLGKRRLRSNSKEIQMNSK